MEDGGKADEDLFALKPQPKPAVPTVRELVAEIGKNPARYEAKYPAKDFTPFEMQAYRLMQAAKQTPNANRYLESLSPYFDSQLKFDIGAGSDAGYVEPKVPNLAVVQQLQDVKNTIPHELTHTVQLGKGAGVNLEGDRQMMQRAQALPVEMQQSVLPSGNRFENMKETWANINARAHEVNAAGGDFINSPEGQALFPTPELQREYYTKAMPGVNSMTPSTGTFVPNKAHGGAVHKPDGGMVKPDPYFAQGQTPFAEYRHSIGMNQGGKHFDEGGEVSQSELDRMKFEIAQAQNPTSPVMQATPRSPVQDFIGTFGGYMDRAGRFVSEALEPIAETNPVKHFLGNMILADSLKNAGTALQDYTGTVRETDEDNPVRGVISKDWRNLTTSREPMLDPRVLDVAGFVNPLVKGATKLAGAGAKAAAPYATKVDDMVRELYDAGMIPQPGLSIKDVTPSSSTISENPYAVSTRLPTAVKSTENPLTHNLIVDMDTFKRDPVAFSHNVDLMEQYPSLTSKAGNAEEKAAEFKNQIKDNLLWLHDQVPTNTRERSKLWYDGARNIVDKWNQNYGVPEQASSGVFAVLSPQKDWFMNVSLGNRVMDTLLNRQNHLWDSAMNDVASQIYAKPQYQEILNAIRGKRLSELDDPALKAMWLRTYDEAKNDRAHHIITPEGNSGGIRLSGKGEPYQTGWGSNNEIAKAIKIFEDPSKENISNNLGSQHKVRNFYNNIYNPNDPSGHVTIDTHAVAAGLLSPFSGKSREVAHNFGSNVLGEIGPKNSSVSGMQGTYGLYADAYRDAAKERAILPREMQSITWEAVRGLFPDTFKTAKNSQAINDIWSQYKNGSIDLNQARQKIFDFSGGIRPPEWER